MSTGRITVRLEDLAAHVFTEPQVEEFTIPAAAEVHAQVTPALRDVTADALESGLSEWSSGLPADWQYRTTDDDVRELAGELAKRRLDWYYHPMIDALVRGRRLRGRTGEVYTASDARMVGGVLTAAFREVVQGLPKTYTRVRKPARSSWEPRTYAPPSAVVTRYVNGDVTVNGEDVTEVPADALLPPEARSA